MQSRALSRPAMNRKHDSVINIGCFKLLSFCGWLLPQHNLANHDWYTLEGWLSWPRGHQAVFISMQVCMVMNVGAHPCLLSWVTRAPSSGACTPSSAAGGSMLLFLSPVAPDVELSHFSASIKWAEAGMMSTWEKNQQWGTCVLGLQILILLYGYCKLLKIYRKITLY